MIRSLTQIETFNKLSMEFNKLSHAYLLYSKDKLLNDYIAELFAMKIFCNFNKPCFECEACKKMMLNKNPDFIVIDKPSILVDDILSVLEDAELKPMIYSYKVILIKNADCINEIAQNKLLKTLEEPNMSTIFILTCTSEEKLLATVKSRVKKLFLSLTNTSVIKEELLLRGINEKFINSDFTLTEMIENSNNKDYISYIENVEKMFLTLKSTINIPNIVNGLKLNSSNKLIYIELLSKLFKSLKLEKSLFNNNLTDVMKAEYPVHLIVKVESLIEDAYRKLKSNVNANYVFDSLLYAILKEKYLCKQ